MKCQVCKIKEAEPNSIVCSDKCNNLRLSIMRLQNKYTPTHGCDNCWGDLHQGCTEKCKEEFKQSREFGSELWQIVKEAIEIGYDIN